MLHLLKKILPSLVSALLLTSCGFEPLMQQPSVLGEPQSEMTILLAQVKVPTPLTRSQQLFTNAFLKQVFVPGSPAPFLYNLRYEISESISGLGLLNDGTSSISEVTYTIPFTLSDSQTGKTILKDQVSLRMTYTISNTNPYTTVVGKEGTDFKAFTLLAQALALKLAVGLSNLPDSPPIETASK